MAYSNTILLLTGVVVLQNDATSIKNLCLGFLLEKVPLKEPWLPLFLTYLKQPKICICSDFCHSSFCCFYYNCYMVQTVRFDVVVDSILFLYLFLFQFFHYCHVLLDQNHFFYKNKILRIFSTVSIV